MEEFSFSAPDSLLLLGESTRCYEIKKSALRFTFVFKATLNVLHTLLEGDTFKFFRLFVDLLVLKVKRGSPETVPELWRFNSPMLISSMVELLLTHFLHEVIPKITVTGQRSTNVF